MPRYELKNVDSRRSWIITLWRCKVITRWDAHDSGFGQETQRFRDAEQARHEFDRLVAEKVKEGYELVNGEAPPHADETPHDTCCNPELEAAIEKDPDNVEGYLVYGDWLQGRGDPRGELIALQCAAHQTTGEKSRVLQRRASAIMRESRRLLLGELADREEYEVRLEWRFGFIRSARVEAGTSDSRFDVAGGLRKLMTLPSARFLRELTVGLLNRETEDGNRFYAPREDADFVEPVEYDGVVHALAETPCRTLERLFIGDFEYPGGTEISWAYLRDVSPLYKALPGLRVLKLRGGWLELGTVDLPELREFTVETGGLPLEAVRSIVTARWPKLERLELWFGAAHSYYGAGGDEKDLQPLLDGEGVPNLKHLGLCNASFTHRLCAVLPGAKILPQLESLDLSKGSIMDEEAAVLARHAVAFKHLKHLDVTENLLLDEGEKRLATLCESVATGNQRDLRSGYWLTTNTRFGTVGE